MTERVIFNMTCPGCGYNYYVGLITSYSWELCPICGQGANFSEFCQGKADINTHSTLESVSITSLQDNEVAH